MAKFPLEYNNQDSNDAVDAINYVLSGPSGLGQNFSGFSDYNTVYLTGNFRTPFTTFSVSPNTIGASGTNTLIVDDLSNIVINDYVTGPNIGVGAQVTGITPSTNTVTLSVNNTDTVSGLITFSPVQGAYLYVAPITIGTITWVSSTVITVTFASAQSSPPFQPGNTVTIAGNSVTQYNQTWLGAGVVSCTTTSVTIRGLTAITPNPGVGTGGTISMSNTLQPPTVGQLPPTNISGSINNWVQTDASGYATVTGPTDRVFISGQLDQTISYVATASSNLRISVAINRYVARNIGTVANPQLRYTLDSTVAQRNYLRSSLNGTGTLTNIETIFSTFIDPAPPGYYQYRMEVLFRVVNDTGNLQVNQDMVDVRALSCQVVKQ